MDARVKNIDRFQVRKTLGEGGQGTVYLAHDPTLGRDVAIKTLTAENSDDVEVLLHEARAVATLRHPCIVPVFEAGNFAGMPYLVFEFVTGETLQDLIQRCGALPAEQAFKIAAQVLDGLAHAHKNGVLHRDIKPANIMIGSEGTPRIMDFGAATRQHLNWLNGANVAVDADFIGTPAYMAPEYIEKRQFSAKNDIFAAGLVFCEMLTGQRVFTGGSGGIDRLFHRIVYEPVALPPGSGLSEKIVAWLLKALEKDPLKRYDSVVEMREILLQATDSEASQAAGGEGGGTLEFLLRRMKLKKEFPALSESVSSINRIVFSDKSSVAALTNAVLKDFALTSKIIRLANSAYYGQTGTSNGISTISAAIYRLGFDTIRNMVLGLLLFDQVKDREQARELMSECAQAILGGAIGKELCVGQGMRNAEETFVCSMMHNLGRMLSLYYFPEETSEIRKLLQMSELSEDQAAKQVLGASYTELGQGVAKSWGFPATIVRSMDKRPPSAATRGSVGADEQMRLIACMAAELSAVAICGDTENHSAGTRQVLEKYKGYLKVDQKSLDALLGRSLEKFDEYTKAVGWKLDRSIANRLTAFQANASEEGTVVARAPSAEVGANTVGTNTADLVKTMRVEPGMLNPSPAPDRPPASRQVLSGGIQDITNALVEGRTLNDIVRIIVETIYTGIGFDHVIFALRDPKQGLMLGRFGLGTEIEALIPKFRFPLRYEPDVFHLVLQNKADVFLKDLNDPKIAARVPAWYRTSFNVATSVLLPIIVKDAAVGLIYGGAATANSITVEQDELQLLRTLRNQAVLALRQSA